MNSADRRLRQLDRGKTAVVMWALYGNPQRAAAKLNVSETTLRRRATLYCTIMGYDSPVQAAYALGKHAQIGQKVA